MPDDYSLRRPQAAVLAKSIRPAQQNSEIVLIDLARK